MFVLEDRDLLADVTALNDGRLFSCVLRCVRTRVNVLNSTDKYGTSSSSAVQSA